MKKQHNNIDFMNKILFFGILGILTLSFSACRETLKDDKNVDYLAGGYYKTMYKADSLFIEKNYKQTFELLDSLFVGFKPINFSGYYEYKNYIASAYAIGKKEIAYKGFPRLVSEFGTTWFQVRGDSILNLIASEIKFDRKAFNELEKKHLKKINTDLREEIYEMRYLDQLYRKGRKQYLANRKKQDSIDDINTKKIIDIFETVGYPNVKVVGKDSPPPNSIRINAILLHTEDSIRFHYFLPKLKEFIRQGNCLPTIYASVYDQRCLYQKRKQKYGTYNTPDDRIQSLDSLDFYRQSVGLPSRSYEKWRREKKYAFIAY